MNPQEKRLQKLEDILKMVDEGLTKEEFVTSFEKVVNLILELKKSNADEVDQLKEAHGNVVKDLATRHDTSASEMKQMLEEAIGSLTSDQNTKLESTLKAIETRMATVRDGIDADPEAMLEELTARMADTISPVRQAVLDDVEKNIPELGTSIRDALELLPKGEKLRVDAIEGLEKLIAEMKASRVVAGPSRGHYAYAGTTKKGLVSTVNYSTGLTTTLVNGVLTVTSTGGGGGFTALTATETPNSARTTFTFAAAAAQPTYLVVDNVWMKATTKSGAINWTWAGTVATLTVPPNEDIWGVV